MKLISIFSGIVVFFMLICSQITFGEIRGKYQVLNQLPKKNSAKTVVLEEFLNFGCSHCNNFNNLSQELRQKYANKVKFVDVPILFQGQIDAPIRLYYVAQSLGKDKVVKQALFDAAHKYRVNVFDEGVVNYIARSTGLGSIYQEESQKSWVSEKVKQAEARAKRYGVTSTPTIILQNSLKMDPQRTMIGFVQGLTETIDDLLVRPPY